MSETDAPFEREDHNVEENRSVEYDGPAGGWGSLRGIASIFGKEWDSPAALDTLAAAKQAQGFHVRILFLGQAGRLPRL